MTELIQFISIIAAIITFFIHIIIALAMYEDAQKLKNEDKLWLLSAGIYAFTGLLLGLIAAAIYWAIHYSTLKSAELESQQPETDTPTE